MSIHLRHAAACYQAPDGEVEAVRDVSFDLEDGEFVVAGLFSPTKRLNLRVPYDRMLQADGKSDGADPKRS